MSSAEYKGLPFMRHSALIHSIEEKYDLLMEKYVIHSHDVSKALIKEFAWECADHGVPMVVAGITLDSGVTDVLHYCEREHIPAVDIAVDYLGKPEFNLTPHDNHPNALANRMYAEKPEEYLRTALAEPAAAGEP